MNYLFAINILGWGLLILNFLNYLAPVSSSTFGLHAFLSCTALGVFLAGFLYIRLLEEEQ